MATTNSALNVGLLLLILCLGVVCVGGSNFQSSVSEPGILLANEQDTITELKKEVAEQSQMIMKQEETIQQLEQKLHEQEKRLDKLSLQFENSQSQVNNLKCSTCYVAYLIIVSMNQL